MALILMGTGLLQELVVHFYLDALWTCILEGDNAIFLFIHVFNMICPLHNLHLIASPTLFYGIKAGEAPVPVCHFHDRPHQLCSGRTSSCLHACHSGSQPGSASVCTKLDQWDRRTQRSSLRCHLDIKHVVVSIKK